MIDESTKIIDDLIRVCKDVQPDLDAPEGSITGIYKTDAFEDLFQTIGDLYRTLVAFDIPTEYLTIKVGWKLVYIEMDYRGMKILCPVYGEEEEDEE